MQPKLHYSVYKGSPVVPVPAQINPTQSLPSYLLTINFNITFPSKNLFLSAVCFHQLSLPKPHTHFLLYIRHTHTHTHTHTSRPSNPPFVFPLLGIGLEYRKVISYAVSFKKTSALCYSFVSFYTITLVFITTSKGIVPSK
jgi:hypothetical protein